jgi:hypothetical protein
MFPACFVYDVESAGRRAEAGVPERGAGGSRTATITGGTREIAQGSAAGDTEVTLVGRLAIDLARLVKGCDC